MDEQNVRVRINQNVLEFAGRQERIHPDRHGAHLQAGEETDRPFRAVERENRNAIPGTNAQRLERVANPIHLVGNLAEGELAFGSDKGRHSSTLLEVSFEDVDGVVPDRKIGRPPWDHGLNIPSMSSREYTRNAISVSVRATPSSVRIFALTMSATS